jgi:glutamate--cysteine ligase
VKDFSKAERHALRDGVPKHALDLEFRKHTVRELSLEALKIADHGLKRRNVLSSRGADESIYIEPLLEIALSGKTQADTKLEQFHGKWNGSVDPVFREYAY